MRNHDEDDDNNDVELYYNVHSIFIHKSWYLLRTRCVDIIGLPVPDRWHAVRDDGGRDRNITSHRRIGRTSRPNHRSLRLSDLQKSICLNSHVVSLFCVSHYTNDDTSVT